MPHLLTDEEVGRQILRVFMNHNVRVAGSLRRNYFTDVRDADFQRGLKKAIDNHWITLKLHDRYTYILTEQGYAAGADMRVSSGA